MELAALVFVFFIMEPTVILYPAFDAAPPQVDASVPWGVGFRARITGGTWEHAVRVRTDLAFRSLTLSSGSSSTLDYFIGAVDYLHHGGGWGSRWYYGAGLGYMDRSYYAYEPAPDPETPGYVASAGSVTGSVLVGRAHDLRKGQLMFEARVDVASLDGKVQPFVALSFAYRHHFQHK